MREKKKTVEKLKKMESTTKRYICLSVNFNDEVNIFLRT